MIAAALAVWLFATSATAVLGHIGGPEQIIVYGDHVDPGTDFRVLASGIEPDVDVALRVTTGSTNYPMGSVHVAGDGTFDVTLALPASVPNGYAQLVLTQPSQGEAGTTFLVGPRGEGASLTPTEGGSFFDSRLGAGVVFAATLVGIALIAIVLIRGRGKSTR